jgi:hypothetical protein
MTLPNIDCARIVRDGGIDAMAALNAALINAIVGLPALDQERLKLNFARAMAEITIEVINPAAAAFPELEPDEDTWKSVARVRATARADG